MGMPCRTVGARAKPAAPAHDWTKGHGHGVGVVRTGTQMWPSGCCFSESGKDTEARAPDVFFDESPPYFLGSRGTLMVARMRVPVIGRKPETLTRHA